MSEHRATISWERSSEGFDYDTYSRDHVWEFEGGTRVDASAAPEFRGDAPKVNPEEAFVAALSSCHMLTFLAIAARKRMVVDAYQDAAVGYLEKNEQGRLAITRVVLAPVVTFAEPPSAEELARLHAKAHENCFIASSVKTDVRVAEPVG
jgi:organic hydroperoxide reductase OsmC/OhrA